MNEFDISKLELPKKEDQRFKDHRNGGLNRVYFYFNKITNELFAIDKELQASHLHRQKEFPYYYLGWTDGKQYYQELKQLQKRIKDQVIQEAQSVGLAGESRKEFVYTRTAELTQDEDVKKEMYEILKHEAIRAQQNPDSKIIPRDFRKIGLDGEPIAQGNPLFNILGVIK